MNFIDSERDHVARPVDHKHVLEMAMKAALGADGRHIPKPTFSRKWSDYTTYVNCVCGKDIEHNFLVCCVETGKAFIVGSKCIDSLCFTQGFTLELRCSVCDDTIATIEDGADEKKRSLASGRKERCKTCILMFRRRNNVVGVGKYSHVHYKNLRSNHAYIAWLREQPMLSRKLADLLDWFDYIEGHPELLKDEPPALPPDLLPENTLLYETVAPARSYTGLSGPIAPARSSTLSHEPVAPKRTPTIWLGPVAPTGSSLLSFGKHKGKTFDHLLEKEPDYCRWVLGADAPTGALKAFQDWLKTREDSRPAAPTAAAVAPPRSPATAFRGGFSAPTGSSTLSFGKHKGRTYADMLAKEPEYCGWVQDKDSPTGPLKEFQEWLNAQ
jgi:uncharacterized protein (DUF3820 family)